MTFSPQAGDDYRDVALAIQALPPLDPRIKMGQDVAAVSKNDVDLLQAVLKATSDHVQGELGEELLRFRSHFGTDSDELPEIARAIIGLASSSPRAAAKGSLKSVSVNTTATMVLPTAPSTPLPTDSKENDFRAELERLRAQLEAELRAAREEAELQRRKAEEAIKKMEEEAQRADGLLDEMRKRLKTMHSALQKAGVEKEAEEALEESGLVTFFKGRDVFGKVVSRCFAANEDSGREPIAFAECLADDFSQVDFLVMYVFEIDFWIFPGQKIEENAVCCFSTILSAKVGLPLPSCVLFRALLPIP